MPSILRSGATGHRIHRVGPDHYRLSWVIDRKYEGSRLRHPTTYRRDTDEAGAQRFAAKWGVAMPEPKPGKVEAATPTEGDNGDAV